MADEITNDIQKAIFRHQELLATPMKTDAIITSTVASCQSGFI